MQLTEGQQEAVKAIQDVQKSHPEGGGIVVISGYAGTGKTTLLKTLAEEHPNMLVVTPTGKAALRVKEAAGVEQAMTIARWMLDPEENKTTGEISFKTKDFSKVLIPPNRVVFVDEASMVSFRTFKDMYSFAKAHQVNLVFLGDGFQLPPVEAEMKYKNFSVMSPETPAHYRVNMTEVLRQALDSPIIRASMELRDMGKQLGELNNLPLVLIKDLPTAGAEVFGNGGAVIVHKNVTRHMVNSDIRRELGYIEELPQEQEPVLILQNDYGLDVYNGEVLTFKTKPSLVLPYSIPVMDRFKNVAMNMFFYESVIDTPGGDRKMVFADKELFGTSGEIGMKAIRNAGRDITKNIRLQEMKDAGTKIGYHEMKTVTGDPCLNVNLGYCLTAHKAQGSQFPEVLVGLEGSVRLHTSEGRRWAYTALTRAQKAVRICWLP